MMNTLQILRAGRTNLGYLGYLGYPGYHLYHAPGASVHYSTAAAAAAAPDGSRSFCLSRDRLTMRELNTRLASYLQQVQYLEEDNLRLELLIQEELSRKSPTVLKEMDKYLGTVSQLQDQINECLSAQAQVKLELLSAELTISHFSTSCERESEHCARLEAGLNDLRLLGEELVVHKLPELQSMLNDETEELMELEMQYQQEREALLAQGSGDMAVELQSVEPSHLIQQLDSMRRSNAMMLDQEQDALWYNPQVPELIPLEETVNPAEEELMDLRGAAAELEEELRQLQEEHFLLEASAEELTASFVLQLVALQQEADELCRDLDSAQQTAAQQAHNYHTLLDIKNRLESEIHDYEMLLDGLNQERVSSLHLYSRPTFLSSCASVYPAAPEIFMPDTEVSVWGGNHQVADTWTVRERPAVTPVSETVTTNQSVSVHTTHPPSSTLTSIKTSNLAYSLYNSSVVPEGTAVKSDVDQVHECPDGGAVVTVSEMQINSATTGISVVSDTASTMKGRVEAKSETCTSKPTTIEASSHVSETETHIQTEIIKTIGAAETDLQPPSDSSIGAEVALEVVLEETPSEVSLLNEDDIEKPPEKEDKEITAAESALLVKEAVTESVQVSNNNLQSTTASTDILERVERNEETEAPATVEVQETLLTTTESKTSVSVTESVVALSSVSSTTTHASSTPGVQPSPAETEVVMTTTDKELCPVVTEQHIKIETKGPASANDKESCQSEKTCTRVTKKKGQSVSFSGEQVMTGESSDGGVVTGESLCSGVSPGGRGVSEDQEKTVTVSGSVAAESGVVEGSSGGKAAASSSRTVLTSSGPVRSTTEAATAGAQGKTVQGGGDWMVYGSGFGHRRLSTSKTASEEDQSEVKADVTIQAKTGRFGKRGSGEFMVYTSSLDNKNGADNRVSLPRSRSAECQSTATHPATVQPKVGRFSRTGSMESVLYVTSHRSKATVTGSNGVSGRGQEGSDYGGSTGNIGDPAGSNSLLKSESDDSLSEVTQTLGQGRRNGSWGSGEWRVYGGIGGRLSRSVERVGGNEDPVPSSTKGNTSDRPRLSSAGSGGKLSTSCVVRRSNSAGSGGQLFTSGSGGKISSGTGSYKISSSGSGERKPVYSSASGRRSTSQRAQSPRRVNSGGSGGWLNTSGAGGHRVSGAGSGSKLSGLGTNDNISGRAGGRIVSSGGRVISSSDGPVRSTGSGTASKKERISVCKMAALSISAAGRERGQDRQRHQQQQQAAAASPLIQRWLTTSDPVSVGESDGLDDIMHL